MVSFFESSTAKVPRVISRRRRRRHKAPGVSPGCVRQTNELAYASGRRVICRLSPTTIARSYVLRRSYEIAFLFLLLVLCVPDLAAQKVLVEAEKKALLTVPANNRKSLVERLNLHILYLQSNNVDGLFDLATERRKAGLTKVEFVKKAKVSTEGEILKFKIQRVAMASTDEYSDEPPPGPDEGNKWFVSGCAKVRDDGNTVERFEMGFDLWLTRGQWFINRGGRRLDNGYVKCKF
jgi:hypothetical protein